MILHGWLGFCEFSSWWGIYTVPKPPDEWQVRVCLSWVSTCFRQKICDSLYRYMFRYASWLISSRFDRELQVMFSHRNSFKPTQSLKLWVFFGLETCILLWNLDDTSSSRKSFCTAKLGTKLCHTPTWLQLTRLCVCVWVRACVHERKTQNNIMIKCQMEHKNYACPFM